MVIKIIVMIAINKIYLLLFNINKIWMQTPLYIIHLPLKSLMMIMCIWNNKILQICLAPIKLVLLFLEKILLISHKIREKLILVKHNKILLDIKCWTPIFTKEDLQNIKKPIILKEKTINQKVIGPKKKIEN